MMHRTSFMSILAALLAAYPLFAKPIKSNVAGNNMKNVNSIQWHTAKDYVQNGLVAMWDGIENAGWETHVAEPVVWKDLINGYDLAVPASFAFYENYGYSASKTDGLVILRPENIYNDIVTNGGYAIEVVFESDPQDNSGTLATIGNENEIQLFHNTRIFGLASNKYNGMGINATRIYSNITATSLKKSWCMSVSLGNYVSIYENGTLNRKINGVGGIAGLQYPNLVALGINASYKNAKNGVCGKYFCIRFYSRALTPDEIARNYAIDKERFGL